MNDTFFNNISYTSSKKSNSFYFNTALGLKKTALKIFSFKFDSNWTCSNCETSKLLQAGVRQNCFELRIFFHELHVMINRNFQVKLYLVLTKFSLTKLFCMLRLFKKI